MEGMSKGAVCHVTIGREVVSCERAKKSSKFSAHFPFASFPHHCNMLNIEHVTVSILLLSCSWACFHGMDPTNVLSDIFPFVLVSRKHRLKSELILATTEYLIGCIL